MRLHTDTLNKGDLFAALITTGLRDDHVWLEAATEHGSRSHRRAFEVQLRAARTGPKTGTKRRRTNTGRYGAGDDCAATYDEWGWWLADLFRQDPYLRAGHYRDAVDFHQQTRDAYAQDPGPVPPRFSMTGMWIG